MAKRRKKKIILIVVLLLVVAISVNISGTQAATQAQINTAIDRGVTWLVSQQSGNGSWENHTATTCFALSVLQRYAHDMGFATWDDPGYAYRNDIIQGWQYVFNPARTVRTGIRNQSAGNPDTNGNGYGVRFQYDSTHHSYTTGVCMLALEVSGTPNRPNDGGLDYNSDGNPDTFLELAQEAVDWAAFAQIDGGPGRGSWYYYAMDNQSSSPDQSAAGFMTLGLAAAEDMGTTVPLFVRTELNNAVNYIQCRTPGTDYGGAGYTSPCYWVNVYKTGHLIMQMGFLGDVPSAQRFQDALGYLERHWRDPNYNPGWGYRTRADSLAMFSMMKGLRYSGVELLDTDGDGQRDDDWYNQEPPASPAQDFASALVTQQYAAGYWSCPTWTTVQQCTALALLTLQRVAPPPPIDLTASKANDVGGTAVLGNSFNWTVTVTNTGDAAAAFTTGQVILRDNLPSSGIAYGAPSVQNQAGVGGSGTIACGIASNVLTCSASGGDVTIAATNGRFEVLFQATPSTTGDRVNPTDGVCQADPDGRVTESDESNNDCSDTVAVHTCDLVVNKAADPETDVTYHGEVTYTVVLDNSGTADAGGTLFTDTLPGEVDFDHWVEQPDGAGVSGDEITWSGTVTAGQAITFTFIVRHVGGYSDVVTNTAEYSHPGSGDSGDDEATFSVEPAQAHGGAIYLPLIVKNSAIAPDLVVDDLVATSNAVTVTIRNAGTAAVNDAFWVDVYFNPTQTPTVNHPWDTIASHGVVWGVTASIPAGGSLVLTTGGDYYFPEYSSAPPLPVGADVYALVDSINYATTYGNVQESNEGNNLFGPPTSTVSVGGEAAPASQGQPASREGLPPR